MSPDQVGIIARLPAECEYRVQPALPPSVRNCPSTSCTFAIADPRATLSKMRQMGKNPAAGASFFASSPGYESEYAGS